LPKNYFYAVHKNKIFMQYRPKKLIFLGTPEFAVPSLKKLIESQEIEVLALVTQPDKAVGRKQIIMPSPTKAVAMEYKIPVFQPEKISQEKNLIEELKAFKADVLVTVAYGQILKENILNLAPLGVINLHASLLPQYRGPAPINWMIINGEEKAGLTSMQTELGIDTGPVLLKSSTEIGPEENAEELSSRLSVLGADLLLQTLFGLDEIKAEKQTELPPELAHTQLAPFMSKKLGEIDFKKEFLELGSANPRQASFKVVLKNSAKNIHNLIRGTYPWPGAFFIYKDSKIILIKSRLLSTEKTYEKLGKIIDSSKKNKSISIACQEGVLELLELKPEGKKLMTAYDWFNGLQAGNSRVL
jgi:methionyl-tRNA formyltransferase